MSTVYVFSLRLESGLWMTFRCFGCACLVARKYLTPPEEVGELRRIVTGCSTIALLRPSLSAQNARRGADIYRESLLYGASSA